MNPSSEGTPEPAARSRQGERLAHALAGRYTVERELGSGGMATVYLAEDVKHRRKVAIKVLRGELAALLGPERFTREIEIAARLNHPHIISLYDSGVADGMLFYVMPCIQGESLRQRLRRDKQLPVDEALRLTLQAAAALHYAHAHGLVHRDIKPENILLHEGEAMVADFGVAWAASTGTERLTATGLALGTPEYMSPEQAAGEPVLDARSDVYSLGCVLYEMLTGEPPYTGVTAHAVIAKRFTDPIPAVRRIRPTVPAGVEQALMRALAPVPADRFESAEAFSSALTAPALAQPKPRSIAVLPFANFSTDPENEFFADGITEDVTAHLSKIRSLKVISRTSVMPYKKREQSLREIGAKLDVATLLEGSVRRAGSRVRVVAQLIDAETDRHLWADTYDRDLTDIFAIQTDVALQIARALEAELSSEEKHRVHKQPTDNLEAYRLYVLGQQCLTRWTQEGIEKGIAYLEQAIDRDPEYALAHTALGYVYTDMGLGVAGALPSDEAFRRAKVAVTRALEIDPGLAEAHAVLGYLKLGSDFDWQGAEMELKRAIELNPNSGNAYDYYGLLLSGLERYDEALVMQQRAHELDPLVHRGIDITTTLLRAGRYDEALRSVNRVLDVDPHFALAHATLGWVYMLKGMPEQGITELQRAVSISPDSTLYLAQLGEAYGMLGRMEEAKEVLGRLEELSKQRYVSPYHMAYVYTGLGEHERALDFLERAYQERAGAVFGIKGSFLFIPLRGHPRFKALLKKMNLGED